MSTSCTTSTPERVHGCISGGCVTGTCANAIVLTQLAQETSTAKSKFDKMMDCLAAAGGADSKLDACVARKNPASLG